MVNGIDPLRSLTVSDYTIEPLLLMFVPFRAISPEIIMSNMECFIYNLVKSLVSNY